MAEVSCSAECLERSRQWSASSAQASSASKKAATSTARGRTGFLLEPLEPTPNPTLALQQGSPAIWNCLVGGKRVREGDELRSADGSLRARVLAKERNEARVELTWDPASEPLASLLETQGRIPLPPYMKREVEAGRAVDLTGLELEVSPEHLLDLSRGHVIGEPPRG